MKKPFPIPGLTKSQRAVFEQIAVGNSRGHSSKTIKKLLEKEAIIQTGREVLGRDRFGEISVPVYAVPLPLHIEWCEWCSEVYEDSPGLLEQHEKELT